MYVDKFKNHAESAGGSHWLFITITLAMLIGFGTVFFYLGRNQVNNGPLVSPTPALPTALAAATPSPDTIRPTTISVSQESIIDQDGNMLLAIDNLPSQTQAEANTEFRGSINFTEAVLSPNGKYLAIGSSSSAHGYGWIYDVANQTTRLVALQTGGLVTPHSFSPDNDFVVFVLDSADNTKVMRVIDVRDNRESSLETGYQVEVDEEANLDSPYGYHIRQWQAPHTLCFTFEGTNYCMDAAIGVPVREAEVT